MSNESTFAEYLNQMILYSGKSQEGVANELQVKGFDLNKTTLWRWCNGTTHPRRDKLPLLQHMPEILGMTPLQTKTYSRLLSKLIGESNQRSFASSLAPRQNFLHGKTVYFAGRKQELQQLKVAISKRQTVLITGLGGVGKSTLARKLIELSVMEFAHGCEALQLSPHQQVSHLIFQVAQRLGISLPEGQVWANPDLALNEIRARTYDIDMLFLLDNVENAAQVRLLIKELPGITWVLTSRRFLYLPDTEPQTFELSPPVGEEALLMLIHYAHVPATLENRRLSAQIVETLGCLPIAIRTAAALITSGCVPDLPHLLQWLQDRGLSILQIDDWSVQAFFDSLVNMLGSVNERNLFELCGAFARPNIMVKAFSSIANTLNWAPQGIDALVALSLVQWSSNQEYLILHPLVHEYAAQRLANCPEKDRVQQQFAIYYAGWAQQHSIQYDLLRTELENISVAADYAFHTYDFELVLTLWSPISSYFWVSMNWQAYCDFNEQCFFTAQYHGDMPAQARASFNIAWYYLESDQLGAAEIWGEKARPFLEEINRDEQTCRMHRFFGILYNKQKRLIEASASLDKAQWLIDEHLQKPQPESWPIFQLMLLWHARAGVAQEETTYDLAQQYACKALEVSHQLGLRAQGYKNMIQLRLGDILYQLGNTAEATRCWCSIVAEGGSQHIDKKLIAGAQIRLAQVEKQNNHLSLALEWAQKARETYKTCGLLDRCHQTEQLIHQLTVEETFDPSTFLFIEE